MSKKYIELTDNQQEELIAFLCQEERKEKNILKALEEMAELSEVLLKSLTKSEKNKPSVEKIVEEAGDVIFRIGILIGTYKLEDELLERIDEKTAKVYEWYQEEINKK